MRILLSFAVIVLLSMTSYHAKSIDTSNLLENQIIGKWIINDVYLSGNNIVQETISERSRWVVLSADGEFKSGRKDFISSEGKWTFKQEDSTLYMVTKNGEKSSWKIKLEGNTLEWNSIGNTGQQDFKFILQKNEWKPP